eukprot:NODE_10457_length_514_cov_14.603581_g9809_i0.p1 GENE.NODE_10457_length_514_cov_14.603581_g9809_i0~~NODE_10457_length_514_cov_14.603581_g9809_i0.p1  ORF type:complete len:113 (-),score=16.03 NODE_10457_length_514_cov_14.603581_g9809_i0:126-464(-)
MSTKTTAVFQLLQAEKKAAELIDNAKKNRVQRIKQAKIDADAEVLKFRQKMQKKFEEFQSEQTTAGSQGSAAEKQKADKEIQVLRQTHAARKEKVSDLLVHLVTKFDLTVPN